MDEAAVTELLTMHCVVENMARWLLDTTPGTLGAIFAEDALRDALGKLDLLRDHREASC